MGHLYTAGNKNARPPLILFFSHVFPSMTAALVALLAMTPAWGSNEGPQLIMPGIGIGPARLGMTEAQAQRVLDASHLTEPECRVDVFIAHGRVIALGTRFGGCLEVPLPPNVSRLALAGRIILPDVGGIGGSPAPFVRAFGDPIRFQSDSQSAMLLWANGLAARVAVTVAGEMIIYLAVVPPNSLVPPYFLLAR